MCERDILDRIVVTAVVTIGLLVATHIMLAHPGIVVTYAAVGLGIIAALRMAVRGKP